MGNSSSCIVQRLSRSTACDQFEQIGSYFHKMPESYFPAKYEFILCILVQVHHLHCPAVVVKSQHTVLTAKNQEGVDILAEHSTTAWMNRTYVSWVLEGSHIWWECWHNVYKMKTLVTNWCYFTYDKSQVSLHRLCTLSFHLQLLRDHVHFTA